MGTLGSGWPATHRPAPSSGGRRHQRAQGTQRRVIVQDEIDPAAFGAGLAGPAEGKAFTVCSQEGGACQAGQAGPGGIR